MHVQIDMHPKVAFVDASFRNATSELRTHEWDILYTYILLIRAAERSREKKIDG